MRPELEVRGGKKRAKHFYAKPERDGYVMPLLDVMPGAKTWKGDVLRFDPSTANMEHLLECFEIVSDDPRVLTRVEEVLAGQRRRVELLNASLDEAAAAVVDFPFKHKPFRHQAAAFGLSRDHKAYGLLLDTGTGKTKVAIDTASYLYLEGKIEIFVIVAPKGVHEQWIDEQVPEHLSPELEGRVDARVISIHRKMPTDFLRSSGKLRIAAINIDAVNTKRGAEFVENLLRSGRSLMVVDESSRIKTPTAKRTEKIIALGKWADYRRVLTGTSVTQGLHDLYSQFLFLDRDIIGHNSFASFRRKYCRMGGYENKAIVGYQHVDELKRKIGAYSFSVKKEDCLDLPPKTYMRRTVELTAEQRKMLKELREDFFTVLDSGEVLTVDNVLSRLLVMQQVTCGHYRTPPDEVTGKREVIELPTNRIDAVKQILDETDEKVIIWSRFIPDLKRLHKAIPNAVTYFGEMRGPDRTEALRRLREDDDTRVLIGQQAAGGIGLNMTAATLMIYFSNDFSAETRWQSEARIFRMGQTRPVTYVDLYTPATPDALIAAALQRKADVATYIEDRRELMNFLRAA